MNAADPFRRAWQASAPVASPPSSLPDLHRRASRFERRIRRRNAIEYAAIALVVAVFGAFAILAPAALPAMRIGAVLMVIGALYVAWQLHRRASARPLPPGLPLVEHLRRELVRQRDAVTSVAGWYLAPFVPGMLLILLGPLIDGGPRALAALGWEQVPALAFPPAFFLFIWWLNRRAARQLQAAIDDLDLQETK